MSRKLLLLSGLGILAVVFAHATYWGQVAISSQADLCTTAACGSQAQIIFYIIGQLSAPAVPIFLFISGFFIAFTVRGSQSGLRLQVLWARITGLLAPYIFWSLFIFATEVARGGIDSLDRYLTRLVNGDVSTGYFFIPLLCQLYLVSILLVPLARASWKLALLATIVIHAAGVALYYLWVFKVPMPGLNIMLRLAPGGSFVRWILYFALGIVCNFQIEQVKRWLSKFKWILLITVIVGGLLTLVEPQILIRLTGEGWSNTPLYFSSSLYAVAFILCFLAFEDASIPFSNLLYQLGTKTYGIYLIHGKLLEIVTLAASIWIPTILAYPQIFYPILIVFAVGVPLLMMQIVARSPVRQTYRYLFG